jgi:sugar/nucleoside kinase (ribokinase family)
MNDLNTINWNDIKERIGLEQLRKACDNFDLLCMLNWSEIENSTQVWNGLLNDVIGKETKSKDKRIVFFDFADCSRRSKQTIREAIALVNEYGKFYTAVLGLNQNEAAQIFTALFNRKAGKRFSEMGEKIFRELNIDRLVLHSSKEALVIRKTAITSAESFHMKHPKVSTGAGDHFNAGFCTGMMLQLNDELCLMLGHAVSACFVQMGNFQGLEQLIEFFQSKNNNK